MSVANTGAAVEKKKSSNARAKVQKFGGKLSGMVMPNIGAFITWGLITAMFLATGWFPNKQLATLIDPMKNYLLPLMIAYTGGENVYGKRGGVIAAAATMGVIVGAPDIPQFMGAMLMGPFAAWCMKKVDGLLEDHIHPGFEMIVNNFSMGFLGVALVLLGFYAVGPIMDVITKVLTAGVDWMMARNLIPFLSLFIEPGKVLFLNNAINHGILGPIGMAEAAKHGKSILFLLEPDPGPGLGVLLAYSLFGKGTAKSTAPGVAIIHCIGGIHEPYFPFILMKPVMIIAPIVGAITGNFVFTAFNVGLVATASPGSFFSILAVAPKSDWLPILLGIGVATLVSFLIGSFILKRDKSDPEEDKFQEAVDAKDAMKAEGSDKAPEAQTASAAPAAEGSTIVFSANQPIDFGGRKIRKIVVACDAGMGSSVMGSSILKKKVQDAGLNVTVEHNTISKLAGTDDEDVIVTHSSLTERAVNEKPDKIHISLENFMDSTRYDQIVDALKNTADLK